MEKVPRLRSASLVVVSERLTSEELAGLIGLPSAPVGPSRKRQGVWEMAEVGNERDDLSVLLDRLLDRARPLADSLLPVCATTGTSCVLRVIQYVGDDHVGPGFAIGTEFVAFLQTLGGFIDVDQYWVESGG
jgi:hypothetical protein